MVGTQHWGDICSRFSLQGKAKEVHSCMLGVDYKNQLLSAKVKMLNAVGIITDSVVGNSDILWNNNFWLIPGNNCIFTSTIFVCLLMSLTIIFYTLQ